MFTLVNCIDIAVFWHLITTSTMFENGNDLESFGEKSARLERHACWITASHVHNKQVLENNYTQSDKRLAKGKMIIFKKKKKIIEPLYSSANLSNKMYYSSRTGWQIVNQSDKLVVKEKEFRLWQGRSIPPRKMYNIRV